MNFDAPSFPVYNQRADLELSTKGSAYDVVNVTFIYSEPLDQLGLADAVSTTSSRNPNLTPADWDVNDFLGRRPRTPETGRAWQALRRALDGRGACSPHRRAST